MDLKGEAVGIRDRFLEEQEHIQAYVKLLVTHSETHGGCIWYVKSVMSDMNLPCPIGDLGVGPRRLSSQEREEISAAIPGMLKSLEEEIERTSALLARLRAEAEEGDGSSPVEEWSHQLMDWYDREILTVDRAVILDRCRRSTEDDSCGGLHLPRSPDIIAAAIRVAMGHTATRQLAILITAQAKLSEFHLLTRSERPESAIHTLRQGFLLLLTAFDAAVFDLVRVALRGKFFGLVGAFGKQDKVSLHEIAELGSFDALRDDIIEEQLKKRYVKDLLYLLGDPWKVTCVDTVIGDRFERLIELVLRRNIHVHNRGVVDERYLGEGKNLDGLKLGELAVIDVAYWEMANRLCKGCVERVAAWANTP